MASESSASSSYSISYPPIPPAPVPLPSSASRPNGGGTSSGGIRHSGPSTEPIQAYYKLQFESFSYYLQTLECSIGRRVRPPSPTPPPSNTSESVVPVIEPLNSKFNDAEGSSSRTVKPEEGEPLTLPMFPSSPLVVPATTAGYEHPDNMKNVSGNQVDNSIFDIFSIQPPTDSTSTLALESTSDVKPEIVDKGKGKEAEAPEADPVDIDLGPLKSISRLHARIRFDHDEGKFFLDVLGRNGAWVDDTYVGRGTSTALGSRTKIQISLRTFQFVLPPSTSDGLSSSSASASLSATLPASEIPHHQSFNAFSSAHSQYLGEDDDDGEIGSEWDEDSSSDDGFRFGRDEALESDGQYDDHFLNFAEMDGFDALPTKDDFSDDTSSLSSVSSEDQDDDSLSENELGMMGSEEDEDDDIPLASTSTAKYNKSKPAPPPPPTPAPKTKAPKAPSKPKPLTAKQKAAAKRAAAAAAKAEKAELNNDSGDADYEPSSRGSTNKKVTLNFKNLQTSEPSQPVASSSTSTAPTVSTSKAKSKGRGKGKAAIQMLQPTPTSSSASIFSASPALEPTPIPTATEDTLISLSKPVPTPLSSKGKERGVDVEPETLKKVSPVKTVKAAGLDTEATPTSKAEGGVTVLEREKKKPRPKPPSKSTTTSSSAPSSTQAPLPILATSKPPLINPMLSKAPSISTAQALGLPSPRASPNPAQSHLALPVKTQSRPPPPATTSVNGRPAAPFNGGVVRPSGPQQQLQRPPPGSAQVVGRPSPQRPSMATGTHPGRPIQLGQRPPHTQGQAVRPGQSHLQSARPPMSGQQSAVRPIQPRPITAQRPPPPGTNGAGRLPMQQQQAPGRPPVRPAQPGVRPAPIRPAPPPRQPQNGAVRPPSQRPPPPIRPPMAAAAASTAVSVPEDFKLPIVVAPVPAHLRHTDSKFLESNPFAVHDNRIILDPLYFSHLGPEQLAMLRGKSTPDAVELIKGVVVQILKERVKLRGIQGGAGAGPSVRPRPPAVRPARPPQGQHAAPVRPAPGRPAPPRPTQPGMVVTPRPTPPVRSISAGAAPQSSPSPATPVHTLHSLLMSTGATSAPSSPLLMDQTELDAIHAAAENGGVLPLGHAAAGKRKADETEEGVNGTKRSKLDQDALVALE